MTKKDKPKMVKWREPSPIFDYGDMFPKRYSAEFASGVQMRLASVYSRYNKDYRWCFYLKPFIKNVYVSPIRDQDGKCNPDKDGNILYESNAIFEYEIFRNPDGLSKMARDRAVYNLSENEDFNFLFDLISIAPELDTSNNGKWEQEVGRGIR